MDLIYCDSDFADLGIMQDCTFDYEASTDPEDCNFEIQTALASNPLKKGYYFYTEGEEYGGRIDTIKIDTANQILFASGRSWRGILGSKIIVPPSGSDYYIASGSVKDILTQLISDVDLSDLYKIDDECEGTISSYQFYRYTDAYSGIIKMLANNDLKLQITCKSGLVYLKSVAIVNYANESEITSDMFDFTISSATATNHVIGLGKGELSERQVIHKYLDADGNIGDTQYYTGINEIAKTYENTECESEELEAKTIEYLKQNDLDKLEIKAQNIEADLGDKFEASEITTGISVIRYVTDKIFDISNQETKISYKVGTI